MNDVSTEQKALVRVRALSDKGFMRCGRRWSRAGDEAEVTLTQLAILQAEKMLIVKVLVSDDAPPDPPPPPAPEASAKGNGKSK